MKRRARGDAAPPSRQLGGALRAPRYHQVYVAVRAWVQDGSYGPGAQLPTEPELGRIFGVSRITVRKAIEELAREGWVVRRQGRGTFARFPGGARPVALDLRTVMDQVSDLAAVTGVLDHRVAEVAPDEETRAALGLADTDRVRRETHVRLLRDAPLGLITTFVPLDVAARLGDGASRGQPMFMLLEAAGLRVAGADQYLGATLAGVEAAQALGVAVGAPLLRLVRVVRDERGRAVERVVALYRADAYQYHMRLEARSGRRAGPQAGPRARSVARTAGGGRSRSATGA
ncbi:MAG: GntR family transcriptional regulator [Gammaproteobacteria bacterium]|nr:GntR family transcriptional regulator [Gammaproteobacteria bacterium]